MFCVQFIHLYSRFRGAPVLIWNTVPLPSIMYQVPTFRGGDAEADKVDDVDVVSDDRQHGHLLDQILQLALRGVHCHRNTESAQSIDYSEKCKS